MRYEQILAVYEHGEYEVAFSEFKQLSALVLLADMPNVPDTHLIDLRHALTPELNAAMSVAEATHSPPAIFDRSLFGRLVALAGDAGARQAFQSLERTATVPIPAEWALDIDTREDLV